MKVVIPSVVGFLIIDYKLLVMLTIKLGLN